MPIHDTTAAEDRDSELDRLAATARAGSPATSASTDPSSSSAASAALDALVRLTRPDVIRYIARRVRPDRVEELTQETYLRALSGLHRFAGRAPVRSWLLAIARNTVADRYRHDAARPDCVRVDGPGWDRLPASPARFDEHLALLTLLDGLTPERRQAFVLTQLEGLTYPEAARMSGVPVGTIRSRVSRARDDLLRGFTA